MATGALITAAGMSSRMGDFKPMLNIGSISIAQRIVANFRQAGVDKIVMVTGYNAPKLERHLAGNGIIFLRNEDYATTQMFDSVKIGLEYLKDKVDSILFTPVDIPLFSLSTLEAIMACDSDLACPRCGDETGHPIKLSSGLVDAICADAGERGLKGALENCGAVMTEIEVNDPGVLCDADTPEDYNALLKYHNSQLIRPEIEVSLSREIPFFDGQMAMLLSQIEETRSVRTACQRMQISYSTGWNIIRALESQLSKSLISRTQGGSGGGSSSLTEYGKLLLERYEAYSKKLRDFAVESFDEFFGDCL